MTKYMGIEYGRGCLATAIDGGPALGPMAVKSIFPNADWKMVTAEPFDAIECARDRFGENFKIQQAIYKNTPTEQHIMIGGDHSVNFGHFAAIADQIPDQEVCMIYIDAHFDIHTPATAVSEASGAPHGCNVRALLGDGDARWLSLQNKCPALKTENLFFLGVRSFEPAEVKFVRDNNIFWRDTTQLKTKAQWTDAVRDIRAKIGTRPFVVSFDFDAIDPKIFTDVLVPASDGISLGAAEFLINEFKDATGFEFVEFSPTDNLMATEIARKLIGIVQQAK